MGVQFPGPPAVPVPPDPLRQGRPQRDPANRLNLEPGLSVLVVGPDPTELLREAVQRVGANGKVTVIIPQPEVAEQLEAEWRQAGADQVVVRVGTPDQLPVPDNSLDRVMAARILHKPGSRQRVLQEFRRVLRPGGLFGIEQRMTDRGSVGPRTVKQWCTAAGFESIWQYGSPLHYMLVFWLKPGAGAAERIPPAL